MSKTTLGKICGLFLVLIACGQGACVKWRKTASQLNDAPETNSFFPNPISNAQIKAHQMRQAGQADAALIEKIAAGTVSYWLAWNNPKVTDEVRSYVVQAKAANKIPVFVLYNAPNRDCGNYSGGGSTDFAAYFSWIDRIIAGLGNETVWLIFEPDIIPLDCQKENFSNLGKAVSKLKTGTRARVYIDIGHPKWLSVDDAVRRLKSVGIDRADGFSLNISNYYDTPTNVEFGRKISAQVNKPFVIDTSRNGRGAVGSGGEDSWCNPKGRGLGYNPSSKTGVANVDAFIWIKNPGDSDGDCKRGEPKAGDFFLSMALELARNQVQLSSQGVIGKDGHYLECRGNQIYVNYLPDVICDRGCALRDQTVQCKDDISHWPELTPGPDGVLRECRGKQIFVNGKGDFICTDGCYMDAWRAKCRSDLVEWPANTPGPDGVLRECRGQQIFVNGKGDFTCEDSCIMVGYLARCKNNTSVGSDSQNSSSGSGSKAGPTDANTKPSDSKPTSPDGTPPKNQAREPTYFGNGGTMFFTSGDGDYCSFPTMPTYQQHEQSRNNRFYPHINIDGDLSTLFNSFKGVCPPQSGQTIQGNNGTKSCRDWCMSQLNKGCVVGQKQDTLQYLPCDSVPGLIPNAKSFSCTCEL